MTPMFTLNAWVTCLDHEGMRRILPDSDLSGWVSGLTLLIISFSLES
jgi:hypothetical protein